MAKKNMLMVIDAGVAQVFRRVAYFYCVCKRSEASLTAV